MANWTHICGGLNGQSVAQCLTVYQNRLYSGTYNGGRLFRLNAAENAWEQVCAQLNGQVRINGLIVYNDRLYAGTTNTGRLFRLNLAENAWEQVCTTLGGISTTGASRGSAIYNGRLYYSTYDWDAPPNSGGKLFRLNAAENAWEQVADTLNNVRYGQALKVFNERLYMSTTYNGGRLYRLNAAENAWEQICAEYLGQHNILCLHEYNNRLYAGTVPNGYLFRLNKAGSAWEQVCDTLNGQTLIYDLIVYAGILFGSTSSGARLFRLNAAENAWEQVCDHPAGDVANIIWSIAEYNNYIYGSSEDIGIPGNGNLYRMINYIFADFTGTPLTGYKPLTTQFTNDSRSDTTMTYEWDFGDGETSIEENPIHTYTAIGVYTVGLTATSAAGNNTKTRVNYIEVTGKDGLTNFELNIDGTPNPGQAPVNVAFTPTIIVPDRIVETDSDVPNRIVETDSGYINRIVED